MKKTKENSTQHWLSNVETTYPDPDFITVRLLGHSVTSPEDLVCNMAEFDNLRSPHFIEAG